MIPLPMLALHFLGDFVLQSDWMATNKSKNWDALYLHTLVYSLCFLPFGFWFYGITFLTHFITDAITSRITAKLWFFEPVEKHYGSLGIMKIAGNSYPAYVERGGNRHWFFVVIGLDQLIHYYTMWFTLRLLS